MTMLHPWHVSIAADQVDRVLGAGRSVGELAEAYALLYVARRFCPGRAIDDAARVTARYIAENPRGPVGRLYARAYSEASAVVTAIRRRN